MKGFNMAINFNLVKLGKIDLHSINPKTNPTQKTIHEIGPENKISLERRKKIQDISNILLDDPDNIELRRYYEELRYISGM